MEYSMYDKHTRFTTGMGKTVLGLMALMAMYLMVHDEADCTAIGLCDYSQHCSDGMMCPEKVHVRLLQLMGTVSLGRTCMVK